jgi:hypothetical protein
MLSGVSCLSPSGCLAVGHSQGRAGIHTLAEAWNGVRWSLQPAPDPNGGTHNTLNAVSCALGAAGLGCTAVGSTSGRPLAVRLDAAGWSVQTAAEGGRGQFSELSGVSCPTLTFCTAVGTIRRSTGTSLMVERWDGLTWSLQVAPNPSARFSELAGVSCVTATACTAVGSRLTHTGARPTLAEHWDGRSWTIQRTPNPASSSASFLRDVSCSSPSACTAVGDQAIALRLPLAERFSG